MYIAGASIFPTASMVNPTYTIIALSIRLADHLEKSVYWGKITASCFDLIEIVTNRLGLNLSWDDDFKLGAYLASYLFKTEYYNSKETDKSYANLKKKVHKYQIRAVMPEILNYPELNDYTSFAPFPEMDNLY